MWRTNRRAERKRKGVNTCHGDAPVVQARACGVHKDDNRCRSLEDPLFRRFFSCFWRSRADNVFCRNLSRASTDAGKPPSARWKALYAAAISRSTCSGIAPSCRASSLDVRRVANLVGAPSVSGSERCRDRPSAWAVSLDSTLCRRFSRPVWTPGCCGVIASTGPAGNPLAGMNYMPR